jgi:hypothetical protein
MMVWRPILTLYLLVAATAGLVACGSAPVYEGESFNPKSPYQYRVPAEVERVSEAARLALLSQGYETQQIAANQLKASKAFQPDEDTHAMIEFNVSCALTREGTILYANALEKRYELKKHSQSAGISVPSIGSITLPWGSSDESLVMVSAKTIDDPDFYKRFYDLVDRELGIKPGAK